MSYEFYCKACENIFTTTIPLKEYTKTIKVSCPKCFSANTKRVYRAPVVIFTGDGFTKVSRKQE